MYIVFMHAYEKLIQAINNYSTNVYPIGYSNAFLLFGGLPGVLLLTWLLYRIIASCFEDTAADSRRPDSDTDADTDDDDVDDSTTDDEEEVGQEDDDVDDSTTDDDDIPVKPINIADVGYETDDPQYWKATHNVPVRLDSGTVMMHGSPRKMKASLLSELEKMEDVDPLAWAICKAQLVAFFNEETSWDDSTSDDDDDDGSNDIKVTSSSQTETFEDGALTVVSGTISIQFKTPEDDDENDDVEEGNTDAEETNDAKEGKNDDDEGVQYVGVVDLDVDATGEPLECIPSTVPVSHPSTPTRDTSASCPRNLDENNLQ